MGRSGDGHVRSERFVVVSQMLESESLEFLYVVSSEDAERSASASCIKRQPEVAVHLQYQCVDKAMSADLTQHRVSFDESSRERSPIKVWSDP